MTTPSQLGTLRGKIDELEAEILDIKKALAAAQTPADIAFLRADIAFLRQRLGDLDKKEILLLEQQNRLQGPAPDAIIDMPSTQDVSVHVEDGKSYTVTLYNGRLDVKALDKSLADEGLVLKTLNGVIPAFDANGMSRTIFNADIQAKTQPKKDEELVEKQKLRVWSTWQWGVGLLVVVIILVMVMVRFFPREVCQCARHPKQRQVRWQAHL